MGERELVVADVVNETRFGLLVGLVLSASGLVILILTGGSRESEGLGLQIFNQIGFAALTAGLLDLAFCSGLAMIKYRLAEPRLSLLNALKKFDENIHELSHKRHIDRVESDLETIRKEVSGLTSKLDKICTKIEDTHAAVDPLYAELLRIGRGVDEWVKSEAYEQKPVEKKSIQDLEGEG